MRRKSLLPRFATAFAAATAGAAADDGHGRHDDDDFPTRTPIKHLVLTVNGNVSFDHYFGTYPHAANTDGTLLHASPRTPTSIDTLATPLDTATVWPR